MIGLGHEHVDTRIYAEDNVLLVICAGAVHDGIPVSKDYALKSHVNLEITDVFCILVHLRTVKGRVREHDHLNALIDQCLIDRELVLDLFFG